MTRRLPVVLLLLAVLAACSTSPHATAPPPAPSTGTPPTSTAPSPGSPSSGGAQTGDKYMHLASALHARGVGIWWETDLVAAWQKGPAAFQQTVSRLGELAKVPGTVGFKVADELGYHDGLNTSADAMRFLTAAHQALHRVAPGKRLLVDAVVLELGCLPWRGEDTSSCTDRARADYPAATVAAVTGYLRSGLVDDLDLSTGLLDPSYYASRGLTTLDAQREAWAHADAWRWPRLTTLQARKALAAAGGYQGSAEQARQDVAQYVDVPVAAGAVGVDIWTWRQPYQGQTVSLLPASLGPNPLWTALRAKHAAGMHLFTHMTPSQMPTDRAGFDHECDLAASVFSDVFVAAGTG